jgi:hypothetical protein
LYDGRFCLQSTVTTKYLIKLITKFIHTHDATEKGGRLTRRCTWYVPGTVSGTGTLYRYHMQLVIAYECLVRSHYYCFLRRKTKTGTSHWILGIYCRVSTHPPAAIRTIPSTGQPAAKERPRPSLQPRLTAKALQSLKPTDTVNMMEGTSDDEPAGRQSFEHQSANCEYWRCVHWME